jgi:unsaturated chondroitin disaccharide hydrolase
VTKILKLEIVRKISFWVLFFVLVIVSFGCPKGKKTQATFIEESLYAAAEQCKGMVALSEDKKNLPVTLGKDGNVRFESSAWWTSGFFPGTLWYLFDYTDEFEWSDAARIYTQKVEKEKNNRTTHDVGFMLYSSFGNAYRLTGDTAYRRVLITGAQSLISRFNAKTGCIKSWESNDKWQYPVIIDNMMNLELLMWAFKATRDSGYYRIGVSHADTTLKNHFRADYSTYHLVAYDTITGKPLIKQTVQGQGDNTAWARGQSWGLYGYTVMYRETKLDRYLQQAKHIADFLLGHKNLPADKIPYWDYNAPDIPKAKRDASAASIMASALIELSGYVDSVTRIKYLDVAKKQLQTLSSPAYLASPGTNGNFILMHSVGSMPEEKDVDVPQTYADYYFMEALIRYRNLNLL